MGEDVRALAEQQALRWSGVKPPNAAAEAMAAQLQAVIDGFEALQGTLEFEDEPSSFEAALHAVKE